MEVLLAILRAAGEETRLRLLFLCAQADLTVSDLTRILGQSQPRISRHLKVLCESGLLIRLREGSRVFYRLQTRGMAATLAAGILAPLPGDDPVLQRDASRLLTVQDERAAQAAAYFRDNAGQWDAVRSLHVEESAVESCLLALLAGLPSAASVPVTPAARARESLALHLGDLVDLGTGTGRMLQLLAPWADSAVGIDQSREMLAVARSSLDSDSLRHCMVRQGDIYAVPLEDACADTVVIYQVLHYAATPAMAIAEAARLLRPGGRLLVADLAPHDLEVLREQHNHLRLGLSDEDMAAWCARAGLETVETRSLPGKPLTVTLWLARRPPC